MSQLQTVWRQLVQRRLLPVAIVLVAALAAVPLLLTEDPEPAPVAPAPVGAAPTVAASSPAAGSIVELAEAGPEDAEGRRRVLGAPKNPFEPAQAPKPKATPAPPPASASPSGAGAGGATSTGGGSTTTVSGGAIGGGSPAAAPTPAPDPPAPPAAAPPEPEHALYSVTVRFGASTTEQQDRRTLMRLEPLPSAEDPVLVFLGVAEDERTAIFLVHGGVDAEGDGTCKPRPDRCTALLLRAGDTHFFEVTGETGEVTASYRLDLLEVDRRTTASSGKAKAARAKVSKAGLNVLRARKAAHGPLRYRYDARTGTVERLDAKAFKAAVARATTAIAGAFDGWR
jgi:hypothetical protein